LLEHQPVQVLTFPLAPSVLSLCTRWRLAFRFTFPTCLFRRTGSDDDSGGVVKKSHFTGIPTTVLWSDEANWATPNRLL
jgi:hypothetical protein